MNIFVKPKSKNILKSPLYDDIRPVVFLDLDNTLISAIDTSVMMKAEKDALIKKYRGRYKEIPPYTVFPRRHLDAFLNYMFNVYRVGVFTAGTREYAEQIVKEFIIKPDPSRVLETFLSRSHVNHLITLKWGFKNLYALPKEYGYKNMDDVYIVDDSRDVYNTQPDRCILVKPFEATDADQGGDTLLNVIQLLDSTVRVGKPLINYPHTNL